MAKFILKYSPREIHRVFETQPFDTVDEAEEYFRLILKPWSFKRVDVVAMEEECQDSEE